MTITVRTTPGLYRVVSTVSDMKQAMVKVARHSYGTPGPYLTGIAAANVGLTFAGAGTAALALDVAAVAVVTAPAWVGAATLVGSARHGLRKLHALHADIKGMAPRAAFGHVRKTVNAWRSDELREIRASWKAMVESDDKFPTGTRVTGIETTPQGRVLKVSRPGQAASALKAKPWPDKIAGWFKAGTATVNVLSGAGGDASRCRILLTERDPFAGLKSKFLWPGYAFIASRGVGGYSVLEPMPTGLGADGTQQSIKIKPGRSHRVIGTSGSGKGNHVLCELLWCLYARDAWCYVIDFEGGADFSRIAHACRGYWSHQTGGNPEDVLDLLISDALARQLTGEKQVTISTETPLLHLLIDGYHAVPGPMWDKIHKAVVELRKYGVHITLLDQAGTTKKTAARPETLRLCSGRIVFCCSDPIEFQAAVGRYPEEHELHTPQGRGIFVGFGEDPKAPALTVQTGWAGDGAHDARDPYTLWSKSLVNFTDRWPGLTTLTSQKASVRPLTPISEAPPVPVVNNRARIVPYRPTSKTQVLWAMLVAAGGGEVTQAHLIASSRETRNTVKTRLREMAEAGVVEMRADGRHAWWRARTVGE